MTKREKELVELMYEAGIREFPEGGEFAAQDKDAPYAGMVSFFKNYAPRLLDGCGFWVESDSACRFIKGKSIALPSLCKNWHITVVTREQYAEYCKMRERDESDAGEVIDADEDGISDEHPQQSTIDMMHRCNELRDIAKQKADQATAAVGDYNDAMESLKSAALALGYKIEPVDVFGELSSPLEDAKPLNITDWRDLQVGDVIEQVSGTIMSKNGSECTVVKIDSDCGDALHIRGEFSAGEERWISKFKFIRRP